MKRAPYLVILLLTGCTTYKPTLDTNNTVAIGKLTTPIHIFTIGFWGKDGMVLTLLDAHAHYLTILIRRNDQLKVGDIYTP